MPDKKKKKKFEVPKMTPPEKDIPYPNHGEDDEFSEGKVLLKTQSPAIFRMLGTDIRI